MGRVDQRRKASRFGLVSPAHTLSATGTIGATTALNGVTPTKTFLALPIPCQRYTLLGIEFYVNDLAGTPVLDLGFLAMSTTTTDVTRLVFTGFTPTASNYYYCSVNPGQSFSCIVGTAGYVQSDNYQITFVAGESNLWSTKTTDSVVGTNHSDRIPIISNPTAASSVEVRARAIYEPLDNSPLLLSGLRGAF